MRLLSSRAAALKSTPVTFTADGAAVRAHRLPARHRAGLARRRGSAAPRAAASGRCEASSACGRGSSASTSRRGEVVRRCSPLQARPDREARRSQGRQRQGRAQGAQHPGRRGHDRAAQLDRTAAAATVVAALSTFDRGKAVALPLETTEPKVKSDDLADAATQARTALSAPIRLSYGETRWRVPRWRIAPLLSLPSGGSTAVSISGRGAEEYLERLSATVSHKPQDAHFQVTATGKIVIRPSAPGPPARRPGDREGDRCGGVLGGQADREPRRAGANPQRTTEIAKTMGIDERRLVLHDHVRRHARAPQQRAARRQADRRHPDRAGRHVLVQRHDRRAHGGEGLPGGAGDHQRRAPERARRRDLPGLDDGVQRGLRGRPADHRAHEPCALHLPLSARARRDRQLPGPRPEVRQRHRPLAAAADVRRRRLAHRQPLRHPGEPPRREHHRPARRDRARAREGDRRPDAREGQARDGRVRLAAARRRASTASSTTPSGKLLYDNTWRSFYVGEPSLVRVGTKEPPKKPVKPKKPGAGDPTTTTPTDPTVDDDRPDRYGSDDDDSRSAVAIASTNHGGTRVGCRVAASTVAWSVSAVATSSPSRSIRYS